jgi:hypothetical protein
MLLQMQLWQPRVHEECALKVFAIEYNNIVPFDSNATLLWIVTWIVFLFTKATTPKRAFIYLTF